MSRNTLKLSVTGESHDELMRLLCNALFDYVHVTTAQLRGRVENSVRLFTVDMPPNQWCCVNLVIRLDERGNGSVHVEYEFGAAAEKAPGA